MATVKKIPSSKSGSSGAVVPTTLRDRSSQPGEDAKVMVELLKLAGAMNATMDQEEVLRETVAMLGNVTGGMCLGLLWDGKLGEFVPSCQVGLSPAALEAFVKTRFTEGAFPFIDLLLESKHPLVIDTAVDGGSFPVWLHDIMRIKQLLAVPVQRRGVVGGIFLIGRGGGASYSRQVIDFVEGVANLVAVSLDNIGLYEDSMGQSIDLAKKMETITVMHEIDRHILSTLSRNEILDAVTANVQRVIPYDSLSIALFDQVQNTFVIAATAGETVDGLTRGAILPASGSLFEQVLKTKRPIISADMMLEKKIRLIAAPFIREGVRSVLSVPLVTGDSVVGTMNFAGKRVGAYGTDDMANAAKLAAQVAVALENARLFNELQDLFFSAVESLVSAIDAKSSWTKGHSERVKGYAVAIGSTMGLARGEIERLKLASTLHDIGKIGIYEEILEKPEPLTDQEFALLKGHPDKGAGILSAVKQFSGLIPAVRHHHERYDGNGYPHGLAGESIPLDARILCVADSFDAMTSDRPYRQGLSRRKAVDELKKKAGTQFDPVVVQAFLKSF
ncbi:MAG: GAF domain-containing protein [Geobacter sp.]|nr:GAF domain-containing protein [Geobacter sp.]